MWIITIFFNMKLLILGLIITVFTILRVNGIPKLSLL